MRLGLGLALTDIAVVGGQTWVLSGATIDLDFANNRSLGGTFTSLLSLTRASNATDLLPSSASGYAYNTYTSNQLAISPNVGLLVFEARTNLFLSSNAPVTQTINLAATGNYTLWVNGSGSAAVAANTATITGAGTATNGSAVTINCTVTGTVDVTISGSLNACQLELGAAGSSFIVTAGASATRAADSISLIAGIGSVLTGSAGFAFVQTKGLNPSTTNAVMIGRASGSNATIIYYQSLALASYSGAISFTDGSAASISNTNKGAVSWSSGGRSLVLNNGSVSTNGTAFTAAPSYLLGSELNANFVDGIVQRIAVGPVRPSDTALKALTQ